MKKKISIITVIVMLATATAFAAPSDQTGNQNGFEQMYQYCNQVMQQWGNGNQSSQGGQAQPQGQPMSYNGGMMMGSGNYGNMMGGMMNGNYGNMMGSGSNGNMMGGMMSNGTYGNMMGSVEFR